MNKILLYISNMIPYIIIAVPIYIILRIIILRKTRKINIPREIILFVFVLFAVGLLSQTVIPRLETDGTLIGTRIIKRGAGGINLIPFKVIGETYTEIKNGHINYFIINFLGNIVMFIPIGFCLPLLWNISGKNVVLSGFLVSLFFEFCQIFIGRSSDIDDIILNTLGTISGLLIYKLFEKFFKNTADILKNRSV